MIKYTLTIFLFLLLKIDGFAQLKPFHVRGQVLGTESSYKYVYLMDNVNNAILGKAKIENNRFEIKGEYVGENRFGSLPSCILILRPDSTLADPKVVRSKKHFTRTLILESDISVTYDDRSKKFNVKGGKLNSVQSQFSEVDFNLSSSIDSMDKMSGSTDGDQKQIRIRKTALNKLADEAYLKLIKANFNSPVALRNFSKFAINQIIPISETIDVFNGFSDELKQSAYYYRLKKDLEDRSSWFNEPIKAKLDVGDQMPAFQQLDINGKLINSNNNLGTYTLIDFWASWCLPCADTMPYVKTALDVYKDKGFHVIAVSIDRDENKHLWLQAIKNLKIEGFTNLISPTAQHGISKTLEIKLIPTNFLVDKNGKVVAVNLHGENLQEKLEKLLK